MKIIAGFTAALFAILMIATLTRQPLPADTTPTPTYPAGREPMRLPLDYRDTLVHYATIDRSDAMSRNLYINPEALAALAAGDPLPDYTIIVIEAYAAQGNGDESIRDENGRLIQHDLDPKIHMAERRSTWEIADLHATSRLGDWNFGSFDFYTGAVTDEPLNDCFSCHDGRESSDFLFSMPELQNFIRTGDVQYSLCPLPGRQRCR